MMERTLKSPRNTYFFLWLVPLLASSAYLLLYEFSLRELSSITFDGTYTLIYLFIGRPFFYISLLAFLGGLILKSTGASVTHSLRSLFRKISCGLLLLIVVLVSVFYAGWLPVVAFTLLINSPLLYVLLGLFIGPCFFGENVQE